MTYSPPPEYGPYGLPTPGQPPYLDPATGQPTGFGQPEVYFPAVQADQPPAVQQPPNAPPFFYPGYPMQPGYPMPPGWVPPAAMRQNGLAIASMVTSIVAIPTFAFMGSGIVVGVVGAILGHVALRQIKRTGMNGRGQALAGVIVGWAAVAIDAFLIFGLFMIDRGN